MEIQYCTRDGHGHLADGFDRLLAARRSARALARQQKRYPRRGADPVGGGPSVDH